MKTTSEESQEQMTPLLFKQEPILGKRPGAEQMTPLMFKGWFILAKRPVVKVLILVGAWLSLSSVLVAQEAPKADDDLATLRQQLFIAQADKRACQEQNTVLNALVASLKAPFEQGEAAAWAAAYPDDVKRGCKYDPRTRRSQCPPQKRPERKPDGKPDVDPKPSGESTPSQTAP